MKAKFFVLGLCALGLAACSLDEVSQINDSNAISFKASVPHSTRAAATSAANLDAFTVWAWTDGNVLMDHVTATNNGSGTYTTNPLYFWPSSEVDFLAVSPVVDATDGTNFYIGGSVTADVEGEDDYYTGHVGKVTIDAANGNKVLFDVPSSYADQIDFCYAVTPEQTSGGVPMNFRHALSQVVFNAKNTNEELEVQITGVRVCSVYKTGEYALPTAGTATNLDSDNLGTDGISETQGSWTVGTAYPKSMFSAGLGLEENQYIDVKGDGDTYGLTAEGGALFLIPQEVEAWNVASDHHLEGFGSYFRIECRVLENGIEIWPAGKEEDATYAEIAVPCDIAWKEGYKYTYTFVFGEGLGYYPPDDPNDPETSDPEATPVLVPINFTVTVDEFQSAGEVSVSTSTNAITVHSLTELQAAIKAGYSEINITESMELTDTYLEFTQDCTLDLADGVVVTPHDVSDTNDPANLGEKGTATSAIYISGGTLTVNAGDGAGIITNGDSSLDTSCFWLAGGNLIINGGTYYGGTWDDPTGSSKSGSSATVYVEYGFAYIYGGTFSSGWSGSMKQTSILNCYDAARDAGEAWIYVYGGEYRNFDPANNAAEGTGTNFVVDGYKYVQSDNADDDGLYWYTVVAEN